jgi:O-antigen/teichoic acid export membrane protein
MQADAAKLRRYVRAAKEFSWLIGGRALALIASLLYIRITAQYLDMAGYGLLAVISGAANALYVFASSPLNLPITRIVNENGDSASGIRKLVSPYIAALFAGTTITVAVAYVIGAFWFPKVVLPKLAMASIPLFVVLYTIYSVMNSAFVAWRARGITAASQCSLAWLRLALTAPLIWSAIATPSSIFATFAAAFVPLLVVQGWILARRHPEAFDGKASLAPELVSSYWQLVRSYAPQVWINASIFFIDKPIFALVLPLEQVAIYAAMQQIARAISSLSIEMGVQFLMPYAFRLTSRHEGHPSAGFLALLAVSVGMSLFVFAFGHQVVELVVTDKYAAIEPVLLAATTFGVCLNFAVNALELKGFAEFSVGRYTIAHAMQFIVFLAGGAAGAARYGIRGIVTCLVFGALVRWAIIFLVNSKRSGAISGDISKTASAPVGELTNTAIESGID